MGGKLRVLALSMLRVCAAFLAATLQMGTVVRLGCPKVRNPNWSSKRN